MRDINCMKTTEEFETNWGPYRPTRRYRFISLMSRWRIPSCAGGIQRGHLFLHNGREFFGTFFSLPFFDKSIQIYMEKLNKLACKVIGIAGCIFLTFFAGFFGLACIATLVMSAIDHDLLSAVISTACGFLAWTCWTIRRDTLV